MKLLLIEYEKYARINQGLSGRIFHFVMCPSPADWRLPPGVNRGLWDYLHDPQIARGYDASLEHTPLFRADLLFCRRHFARPGRLIDLGCGTGRLAVAFAQRGDKVLAV